MSPRGSTNEKEKESGSYWGLLSTLGSVCDLLGAIVLDALAIKEGAGLKNMPL